jgi:hypothetical protein
VEITLLFPASTDESPKTIIAGTLAVVSATSTRIYIICVKKRQRACMYPISPWFLSVFGDLIKESWKRMGMWKLRS